MFLIQGLAPFLTFDSFTTLITGGVVSGVGIYLAKSFLSFKETIKSELTQTREELIKSIGDLQKDIAEHKILFDVIRETSQDHTARIRFLEQFKMQNKHPLGD